jgi:hypothetical protein
MLLFDVHLLYRWHTSVVLLTFASRFFALPQMARQITIVNMEGATDSLMQCVNIRMGVDNDEYIRKFGISNVG